MTHPSNRDRRRFMASALATVGAGALATVTSKEAAAVSQDEPQDASVDERPDADQEISQATIAEAEKLAGITFTAKERAALATTLGAAGTDRYARRRAHALANGTGPASAFDPRLPGQYTTTTATDWDEAALINTDASTWPTSPDDIAFASISTLAGMLRGGKITSVDLTKLYIKRLKTHGPKLECVITLTEELALTQAAKADAELRAGNDRGPLHGIPWGAKDLLDTAGIKTTWGATPFKDRVPDADARVVTMLADAGAVLVAKLTLGALAYGDIWYGGRTNNPWNLQQGSSGSSAGSASATAAGLVPFAIGTETLGSIVSPCMRCGTTGLRPTFGRVSRAGAMALCWSLDKIGPITRTVQDTMIVLRAINGPDHDDPCTVDEPLNDAHDRPLNEIRVGFDPAWFGARSRPMDRAVLDTVRKLGMQTVEISIPEMPYDSLLSILMVEAAAAFEDLTRSDADDTLVWQAPQAWPHSFRETWFVPAIELMQAQRFRRDVMGMMHAQFESVDVLVGPSYAGAMLLITNMTGHPSLTIRSGVTDRNRPYGSTFWGRLYDEGTLCQVGAAVEAALGVWDRRPSLT